MKIVIICRTRNEARNIARFCLAYSWADSILIADGGSTDNTLDIAQTFGNPQGGLAGPCVKVDLFTQKVWQNDQWRNPHGRHINFMIDWALREQADWIIFDDCDCVPTLALQADIRGILSDTDKKVCQLYRLYVWGSNRYFPDLNSAGQSLWGWRADVPVRALEDNPWSHDIIPCWTGDDVLNLESPHCCLHYFCPDPATVERKLTFYRESGEQPEAKHPLEGCGSLALLPEWAKWR